MKTANPAPGKRTPRHKREAPKLSRMHKPDGLTLEQWQTLLRRQFGREQKFKLVNAGTDPVFSTFNVTNPASRNTYRVEIRGISPGDNFCSCPDFATNALGTCKHIEFTLARLERRRAHRALLQAGYQPPYSQIVLRYGARREVRLLRGSQCPRELVTMAADYFDAQGILRAEEFARFDRFLTDAARFDHDLRCHEDALAFVAEVRDAAERVRRVEAAYPQGIRSSAFDGLLKAELYDYQRAGALFAARAGRCLIGDEMGLGKTIQAIAAVEIMARLLGVARILIICPTSLKHQWEREIAKFAARTTTVIGGMRARRERLFADESFYKITNYDTVHADLDLIASWSPDLVILDEAQRIKNWNTRAARSVKRIVSPYAIVLTGTPLENRLQELVSIVDFVDRFRLGPTFKFLARHQLLDEHGKVIGYKDLDAIGKTLEPILIRRRKDQVLTQLPERLDKHFFVPMTPQQMRHHAENAEIVAKIVAKWRRMKFLSEADQRRLMIALQNMRMSCNSTYLLDQTTDFGVKADEAATLLDEMCETPDTKVVVFSQWVRTHELLERRLAKRPYGHVLFHGGVPGDARKGLIDQFREDPQCRAFLSTDAGGVGLNLQHASVVVNMDLPWNPAVLEQRIGRIHRMGQKRPVRVVNFVARGTIEEGMLEILKFKKSLFTGALDGGDKEVFLGGSRLSRFMDTVQKATGAIPAVVPEEPPAAPEEPQPAEAAAAEEVAEPALAPPAGKPSAPAVGQSPWSGLLQTGLTFLEELAAAARTPTGDTGAAAPRSGLSLIRRDPSTGESYLHVPVPPADVLDKFLTAAQELLGKLRT
jgi:superfamily II DNA or RNA helicase